MTTENQRLLATMLFVYAKDGVITPVHRLQMGTKGHQETMPFTPVNPSPLIFPKLIALWNESPQMFYRFLGKFGIRNDDADTCLAMVQRWVVETGYETYLNE